MWKSFPRQRQFSPGKLKFQENLTACSVVSSRPRQYRFHWLVKAKLVRSAGPARIVPLGKDRYPVALAPVEADFTNAAVWKIKLPAKLDLKLHPLLRIHYVGDVARVTLNGKLLDDNFYNGRVFDLGLKRYAPEILRGDLRLEILPLRKEAPIYLPADARPDFGKADSIVKLTGIEIVNRYETGLTTASH